MHLFPSCLEFGIHFVMRWTKKAVHNEQKNEYKFTIELPYSTPISLKELLTWFELKTSKIPWEVLTFLTGIWSLITSANLDLRITLTTASGRKAFVKIKKYNNWSWFIVAHKLDTDDTFVRLDISDVITMISTDTWIVTIIELEDWSCIK